MMTLTVQIKMVSFIFYIRLRTFFTTIPVHNALSKLDGTREISEYLRNEQKIIKKESSLTNEIRYVNQLRIAQLVYCINRNYQGCKQYAGVAGLARVA